MRLRKGFFGGSFDPIHNGHLHLALQLFEIHHLDEVIICPTSQSPHKQHTPPIASKEHRRAMVTAAISPLPLFTFLDTELQKPAPCYTIHTLRSLIQFDPNTDYFLLLGEDTAATLHTWKETEELIRIAKPLIGSRNLAISSSWIRERIGQGLYAGHLVPEKVWEYIQIHSLYRAPS